MCDLRHGSPLAADAKSEEELFSHAVNEMRDGDELRSCDAIAALHCRGGMQSLRLAIEHCESPDPVERQVGALVLGQLDYARDKPFAKRSFGPLEKLLVDDNEDVIEAALTALGHLGGVESVLKFPELASHESDEIRFSVTFALGGSSNPDAVNVLMGLARDSSDRVRDWAVFGLGTQSEVDTPRQREVLLRSLADPDPVVRGEALLGLAERGDTRIVPYLIDEMNAEEIDGLAMQAAGELASRELLPSLTALRGKGIIDEEVLENVIQNCSGIVQLREDQ